MVKVSKVRKPTKKKAAKKKVARGKVAKKKGRVRQFRVDAGVGSVLDRIAPVSSDDRGISMSVYGRSGTGKTTFACTFPKPLLLIGAEDGMQSVRDIEGVDFVCLESADEFTEVIDHLQSGKYQTGVLDTLGTQFDAELREILGIAKVPETKSWGMAQRGDWQQANTRMIERLRQFIDLHKSGMNTLVLAQERTFGIAEEANELIMPFVASACTPGVVGWLNPACDYICQMYLRQKTEEKVSRIGKKTTRIRRKVKGVEYCLRTAPNEVYTTKFRLPRGSEALPECIVDPSFEKVQELIEQGG